MTTSKTGERRVSYIATKKLCTRLHIRLFVGLIFLTTSWFLSCVSVKTTSRMREQVIGHEESDPVPIGAKMFKGNCKAIEGTRVRCKFLTCQKCKKTSYKLVHKWKYVERSSNSRLSGWEPLIPTLFGVALLVPGVLIFEGSYSYSEADSDDEISPEGRRIGGIGMMISSAALFAVALIDAIRLKDTEYDLGISKVVESEKLARCLEGPASGETVTTGLSGVRDEIVLGTTDENGIVEFDLKDRLMENFPSSEKLLAIVGGAELCEIPTEGYMRWREERRIADARLKDGQLIAEENDAIRNLVTKKDSAACLEWIGDHKHVLKQQDELEHQEVDELAKCAVNQLLKNAKLSLKDNDFVRTDELLERAEELLEATGVPHWHHPPDLKKLEAELERKATRSARREANRLFKEAQVHFRKGKLADAAYALSQCLVEVEDHPRCKKLADRVDAIREKRRLAEEKRIRDVEDDGSGAWGAVKGKRHRDIEDSNYGEKKGECMVGCLKEVEDTDVCHYRRTYRECEQCLKTKTDECIRCMHGCGIYQEAGNRTWCKGRSSEEICR